MSYYIVGGGLLQESILNLAICDASANPNSNLNSIVLYGSESPTLTNGGVGSVGGVGGVGGGASPTRRGGGKGGSSSSSGLPPSTSDLILCAGLVVAFVVFVAVVVFIIRLLRKKGSAPPPNAGYRLTPAGQFSFGASLLLRRDLMDFAH